MRTYCARSIFDACKHPSAQPMEHRKMIKAQPPPTHFMGVPFSSLYNYTIEDTCGGMVWRINALYDVDSVSPRTKVRFVRLYFSPDCGSCKRSKGIRYQEGRATLHYACSQAERLEAETFLRTAIEDLQRKAREALQALDDVAAELDLRPNPFAQAAQD
jgi:hypothetical protein